MSDVSVIMPTLLYYVENYSEDSYVIAGLERFKKDIMQHGVPSNIYEECTRHVMRNTSILLIHSLIILMHRMEEIKDGFKESCTFSFKNNDYDIYMSYVAFLSNYFKIYGPPVGGVLGEYLSGSLDRGIMNFAQDESINIKAEWEACFSDEKYKVMSMMKEMLLENIPIVFSYDNTFDKNKDRLILYIWKDGKFVSDNGKGEQMTIGSHYMTATGLIEYSDEVAEILEHKYMLRISSWGQKFYVDYNMFLEKFSMGTNFLYITK